VVAQARAALVAGDVKGAGLLYQQVRPGDPRFPERLADTIRWQLLSQNFQEAWRITELARRIEAPVPDLDYYTALAATRHGTCALGFPVQDRLKRLLLHAHMYRFHNRYTNGSYNARPYDTADAGIQQTHLISDQVQYLEQIPQATLLKRKGCRFFYGRFSSRKIAAEWEYKALRLFRELHLTGAPDERFNIDDVEVRMIELADELKDKETITLLLERYGLYDAPSWAGLEDQRRQFLWQKLIQHEMVPPPPYAKDSPRFPVVLSVIRSRPPDEGLNWLGLINWYDVDRSERLPLINHLLESKDQRYHPFLLTAKTELLYERGEMVEALGLVRRLLLLGESNGDPEIERRVAYIASEILAEFAYSEKVLGALQNSVPASRWTAIFRSLLLKHAIAGNQRGYQLIMKIMNDAGRKGQLQLDPDQLRLVDALVNRDLTAWQVVINKWSEARRIKGGALRIMTDLAAGIVPLTDPEFDRIKSFTSSAAVFLRRYLMQGEQQVRLQDLLLIFDRARASEWAKGGVAVGASAVAAGSVDLRDDQPLPAPFVWNPPARLALADLILVPDEAGNRRWILR
jgi:hypothetical protein